MRLGWRNEPEPYDYVGKLKENLFKVNDFIDDYAKDNATILTTALIASTTTVFFMLFLPTFLAFICGVAVGLLRLVRRT
jgi:hypothetical protein